MNTNDLFSAAHLIVAAIRVLEHQEKMPPSVDKVCEMLRISSEQGNFLCQKLQEMGIVEIVEGGFGTRVFIKDYTLIEAIPKENRQDNFEEEIKKFQDSRKDFVHRIEALQAEKAQRRKTLFDEIESKLKQKNRDPLIR